MKEENQAKNTAKGKRKLNLHTVTAKLALVFLSISIILLSTTLLTNYYNGKQIEIQNTIVENSNQISALKQAVIDHQVWRVQLLESITMDRDFRGALNHTECNFGKYYYSFIDSEKFKQFPSNIKSLFDNIEDPHANLHETAHRVIEARRLGQGNAINIYSSEVTVYVEQIAANIYQLINNLEANMGEEMKSAEIAGTRLSAIKTVSNIAIIASLVVAFAIILNSIVKPLKLAKDHLNLIGLGDFTKDVPQKYLDKKDEFGEIAKSISHMEGSIRKMIRDVAETSQQVAASSQQLTATSQQSATAAEEVARTIDDIARSVNQQAGEIDQGVGHITQLGESIEKDQQYVEQLNGSVLRVGKLKDEGLDTVNALVEKTKASNKASEDVYNTIINTSQSAQKIQSASQMIKSISQQTNLLALNAAIEAARAGDSGRGFAVVAEEIRKLAEQSSQFTGEIEKVIGDLSDKTNIAVKTMEEATRIGEAQTQSVETTSDKFRGIAQEIEKIRDIIQGLNKSGKDMESRKEEIIGIIQNLAAISEENAAGTQEVSASVQEQTASMLEIATASEALAKLAEDMQAAISRFKY